tara:strand:+ start:938 stop:1696 length:759 start_codon:yes stop_codon:yes gene_type:complete
MVNIIKSNMKKHILFQRRNGYIFRQGDYVIKSFNKLTRGNRNEFNILSSLNHPNIIDIKSVYHNKIHFNIVMDFFKNGDTYNLFKNKKELKPEELVSNYLKFIKPVKYLHKKLYAHLDLKFENYLIDDDNNFILIDFELTRKYFHDYYSLHDLKHPCGTSGYMAPEIINRLYGPTSDIYSLGRMFYTLAVRRFPSDNLFNDDNKTDIKLLQIKSDLVISNLILDMLQYNHTFRPTIHEVHDTLIKHQNDNFT